MFDICKEATKKFNFSCSGENSCCDRKTVGDVDYLLVGQNMYKTTYFGCRMNAFTEGEEQSIYI
jgi:hypothetical protein